MEEMDYTGGVFGIVEGAVAGSSSRYMDACTYCTSEVAAGIADSDCMPVVVQHLAACLALPADDGCSSCRRGRKT